MITVREAAAELGISPRRVNALILAGRLPAQLQEAPSPYYLIDPADLARVRERRAGAPRSKHPSTR